MRVSSVLRDLQRKSKSNPKINLIMKLRRALLPILLVAGFVTNSFAAHHGKPLFVQTYLKSYTSETDKLISLAEEFSEEGMEWRPDDGIRSVREAILHVAGANYGIGSRFLGKELPEGVNPREIRNIKSRGEAIEVLKSSVQFVKEAIGSMDDAALAEPIKLFGQDSNRMGAAIAVGGHAYEHLGQLIAYARSSGVVPPWSQ